MSSNQGTLPISATPSRSSLFYLTNYSLFIIIIHYSQAHYSI